MKVRCPDCNFEFNPENCLVEKQEGGIALGCPNCEAEINVIDWRSIVDDGYLDEVD